MAYPPLSQQNGLQMPPVTPPGAPAPVPGSQQALQQLMGLSTIDADQQAIQNQLEQAQALRRGTKHAPAIGWGAGLAQSLGDVGEAAAGAFKERGLRGQQKALTEKELAGRKQFAGLPAVQDLLMQSFMPGGR